VELGPILRAIGRNKARFGLIAVEVALTLAVAVNCVELILEARSKMVRPSGFDDENLLHVQSTPFDQSFRDENHRQNVLRADLEALRAAPGVRAVASTSFMPWRGGGSAGELEVVGAGGLRLGTQMYSTDEGLIDALGIRLVQGRWFVREEVVRDAERLRALFASERPRGPDGSPKERFLQEVVITKAWAEHAFGSGPYLGRLLEDGDGDRYRVIGVVDPFFNPFGLWQIHEYAVFYANLRASYDDGTEYLVRAEPGHAAALTRTIEDVMARTNPMRSTRVQRVTELRYKHFGPQRMQVVLMGLVAVLLMIVTGLGIVGVTSFLVTERTRQIGTRRALGATMVDILRYFLLENWLVTTIGIVVGVGLAIGLHLALASVVAEATLRVGTVAAGAALLWLLGLGSALVPALRAARTSPAVATRSV
jgi:putative ABC transport system permease protein